MVMEYVRELLEREGHTVIAAESPESALLLAREHADTISLLVSDMVMPQMNGHELYERLKQIIPGVSVLFMSGYAGNMGAQRDAEGQADYIAKPFTSEEFLGMIRSRIP